MMAKSTCAFSLPLAAVALISGCDSSTHSDATATESTDVAPVAVTQRVANDWSDDNAEFCGQAFDVAQVQLDAFRRAYTQPDKIPTSFNGETVFTGPMGWTSGFVAGSFWYMYEHTGDESWKQTATDWTLALEKQQFNRKTHDVGFIMNSSFGNGLRLTDEQRYQPILVNTAKTLMERFNPKLGVTFSWSWGTWEFPVIIDNMMNLELLYNASLATGDSTYYDAATSHATVTMKHHFRDDYSSYHLVNYNRDTGLPNNKQTFQGIADDSSWARGQSWGAYGYTMVYRFTKDEKFLNHAQNIVNYVLTHKNMPDDLVPYFDYDAPDRDDIDNVRDSSAASLLASALLELSGYVPEQDSERYKAAAIKILRSLAKPEYLASAGENGHFLLKQATGHYPAGKDINAALNYGDYYYLEALHRCKATF